MMKAEEIAEAREMLGPNYGLGESAAVALGNRLLGALEAAQRGFANEQREHDATTRIGEQRITELHVDIRALEGRAAIREADIKQLQANGERLAERISELENGLAKAERGRAFYRQQFDHERTEVDRLGDLRKLAIDVATAPQRERLISRVAELETALRLNETGKHLFADCPLNRHLHPDNRGFVGLCQDCRKSLSAPAVPVPTTPLYHTIEASFDGERLRVSVDGDAEVLPPEASTKDSSLCSENLGASPCMLPPHEGMHEWWTREEPREYIAWNMVEGQIMQVRQGTFPGNASKLAQHIAEARDDVLPSEVPPVLRSMSPEEAAAFKPISEAQIQAAIDKGSAVIMAMSKSTTLVTPIPYSSEASCPSCGANGQHMCPSLIPKKKP